MSIKSANGINYLIDLKSKESMNLYYGCKLRHGKTLSDRDAFIQQVIRDIKSFTAAYDFIVYPESSSDFIQRVVSGQEKPRVVVSKNDVQYLLALVDGMNLQKAERASHIARIGEMGSSFKINAMKATQRDKYEPHLFKPANVPEGRGLIVDDSCFSGTTVRALRTATGVHDYLAIFAK
ncbi:MAG: hypothetical protein RSD49_01695 [Hafnia sp.]